MLPLKQAIFQMNLKARISDLVGCIRVHYVIYMRRQRGERGMQSHDYYVLVTWTSIVSNYHDYRTIRTA